MVQWLQWFFKLDHKNYQLNEKENELLLVAKGTFNFFRLILSYFIEVKSTNKTFSNKEEIIEAYHA